VPKKPTHHQTIARTPRGTKRTSLKTTDWPEGMPQDVIEEIETQIDQYIKNWSDDLKAHTQSIDAKTKRSSPRRKR
jgi:hypothetical protein